jgi:thimet oligopeptidase
MFSNLNFLKKFLLFFIFFIFSGCRFLAKNQEVINMNDFEKITQGEFATLDDLLKVFPKSVEDINKRVELCMKSVQEDIKKILNIKDDDRTFENTARAMDIIRFKFSIISDPIEVLEMVSPDDQIRKTAHAAALKLREFAVDVFNNIDLYKALKNYVEGNAKKETLDSEKKYFLKDEMDDYHRQGFDLPVDEFEKVKNIKKELSKLSLEYETNINLDNSCIKVNVDALEGLEQDFIGNLKKSEDGKYVLGCDYPTYFEVCEHCKVSQTRKDLFFAFNNRAYPKNMELLNSIIDKRDELAKLLKFDSYAALNIDSEMAKHPDAVKKFLTELVQKTMQKEEREVVEFRKNLPEGVLLDETGRFYGWDFAYLKECYKKKNFDIDERKIAEYFPVENTLTRIFEIYQQFLGLEFRQVNSGSLWHPDVKVIEIYKKNAHELCGVLFLDLYPRDNKYKHACMADVVPTFEYTNLDGKKVFVPAGIVIIANFPKATALKPALLKHDDVVTFFHEFGHAMHGLLGKTGLVSLSGTKVKRDFVEVPSQMFEEWMWDKDILKKVSCHYKTGQALSEDLIDKKIALKKFASGFGITRQCILSFLALDCFSEGQNKNTDQIRKNVYEKYNKSIRFEPDAHMLASFGHLMGYGAKYYGYMWSKVFALDLFYKIKKDGLLDSQVGQKLVFNVLGKGGSVDPEILLKDFLGREPNQEAFLKDLGIV